MISGELDYEKLSGLHHNNRMTPAQYQSGEISNLYLKHQPLTGKGKSFNPNAPVKFIQTPTSGENSYLVSET